MKKIFALALSLLALAPMSADDFVVVGDATKLYDQANVKGTVTLNRQDNEVQVLPGMAFKKTDARAGWTTIEYSPGLRAFIVDNSLASKPSLPDAGTYEVANQPGRQVSVSVNGDKWLLRDESSEYPGKVCGAVVVFTDQLGVPAYTLTTVGGRTYVYNYSNSVTNFL